MAKEMMKQEERSMEGQKGSTQRQRMLAPPVDVLENDDEYLIMSDLPGVDSNDVSVELNSGELTIRAPRRGLDHDQLEYVRVFRVPSGIDSNKLEAELNHGVLKLHLPKEEALKPKQIQVKAG